MHFREISSQNYVWNFGPQCTSNVRTKVELLIYLLQCNTS